MAQIVEPSAIHPVTVVPGARRKPSVSYQYVPARETAFDRPRDWLGNRFVYAVISARARGLSLGVNVNPDKKCNFDCSYCEVDRRHPVRECGWRRKRQVCRRWRTYSSACWTGRWWT